MTTQPLPEYRPSGMESPTGSEMLTLDEASRLLRLPPGTLRYYRHLGTGPRSFKVGRHVRYWKTDLILWLSEQSGAPQGGR